MVLRKTISFRFVAIRCVVILSGRLFTFCRREVVSGRGFVYVFLFILFFLFLRHACGAEAGGALCEDLLVV